MRRRTRLAGVLAVVAVLATMAVPATAHHVDLHKAEVDFGTCREIVGTKTIATATVADYLPSDVGANTERSKLVIRAAKCRWLEVAIGDRTAGTRHPIVIQVGVAIERDRLPSPDVRPVDELYALFTVTNSRALARAARAAGHARVYLSDDVRFRMGRGEACGDRVRAVVAVRDDRAPSFRMRGLVSAPGPKCDVTAVGPTAWWTVRHDVASAFMYLENRQSVVRSETQLEVWAGRNTRMNRIVGTAHFMTDTARTGLIGANDRSPDAVIVPHALGG
jgi:hypothetical protein